MAKGTELLPVQVCFFLLCLLWNFNYMYSYWANTSFTNHGLRTGVFAWTVEHSFLNQYVIMES